jgi:hypothetical protein
VRVLHRRHLAGCSNPPAVLRVLRDAVIISFYATFHFDNTQSRCSLFVLNFHGSRKSEAGVTCWIDLIDSLAFFQNVIFCK